MTGPIVNAASAEIASDVEFGDDVIIEAEQLTIGQGASIGFSGDDDFRTPAGVRIRAQSLVLGAGVQIGRAVRIAGGAIRLDDGVRVMRHATVRVVDELHVGAAGTIGESCELSGRRVEIGQELWMLPGARIGGGSAFENASALTAGHYLHVGASAMINTARPVVIGHEVGLGTRTSIYTHGAYPSRLHGFPVEFAGVEIGDFTWVPGAIINPGVRIGRNCVVGVNSLVTRSLPDGCLAAGSPAKVIREGAYPKSLSAEQRLAFWTEFLARYAELLGVQSSPGAPGSGTTARLATPDALYVASAEADALQAEAAASEVRFIGVGEVTGGHVPAGATLFDTGARRVRGVADRLAERFGNELRRYGIRFYSRPAGETYVEWEANPPEFGEPPAGQPSAAS